MQVHWFVVAFCGIKNISPHHPTIPEEPKLIFPINLFEPCLTPSLKKRDIFDGVSHFPLHRMSFAAISTLYIALEQFFFNTSRRHFGEVRETFSVQNLHLPLIMHVLLEILRPIGDCAQLSGNDSTVQKVSLIEAPGLPSFYLHL